MPKVLRLLVGLGNPGPRYAETRHNAGFWLLDRIADSHRARFSPNAKFQGESARVDIGGGQLLLLKPDTFMNRSGQSVGAVARFYKIPTEQIAIAHDEIDLPPGVVRLKTAGGHGGHNGLRDIIAHLGDNGFQRIRLGVGHPGHRDQVHDYVLHRPGADDAAALRTAIDRVLAQFENIITGNWARAMNELHRDPAPASDE